MRPLALLALICLCSLGCGDSNVPQENYFGGKPVEHWLEAARSSDARARKKAADVLGNVGASDPLAIPALIDLVKDRDATVRDTAVLGLSRIGPPAAAAESVLQGATKDQNPTIRAHAATALERVRGAR